MKEAEKRGHTLAPRDGRLFDDLPSVIVAAHELKAPLTLIRQLALSLESGTSLESSETQKLLRQITLVSEKALRLTTDLTRASRLEESLFTLEPLNPQRICEEVAHELTPLYRAHGREIRVGSVYRQLLAVANRDLLRRIILNFGDNALYYGAERTPVELQAGICRGAIRIKVRDFGPAIPVDLWGQLQASLGTNRQPLHSRPQSSGLGLFVAGQFAQAMRGRIGAIRHHDGASFYVDLMRSSQLSLL